MYSVGDKVQYRNMVGKIQGFAVGNDGQQCYVVDVENRTHRTNLFPIDKAEEYVEDSIERVIDDLKHFVNARNDVALDYLKCEYRSCDECPHSKKPCDVYDTRRSANYLVDCCIDAIPYDIVARIKKLVS